MRSEVLEGVRPVDTHATARHLSVRELAEREAVPVATVYAWRASNKGPRAMRIGKFLRYRLDDVLAWEETQLDPQKATA
ncbi:AlpA family transcriptional regulator [Pseudarthrobacter sp. SSS035]|uniref:helix-turn-helix transcriptional regulator n=1 Tax=Pseudarthrobacter sp. SSS035 TaxID=2931399 RepID=UPI0020104E1D|nr:helix-turn-helix domain-containing protein [Pseudarthrobacter sp. SSS035]